MKEVFNVCKSRTHTIHNSIWTYSHFVWIFIVLLVYLSLASTNLQSFLTVAKNGKKELYLLFYFNGLVRIDSSWLILICNKTENTRLTTNSEKIDKLFWGNFGISDLSSFWDYKIKPVILSRSIISVTRPRLELILINFPAIFMYGKFLLNLQCVQVFSICSTFPIRV